MGTMEPNWVQLLRHNCTQLISQAISGSSHSKGAGHRRQPDHTRDTHASYHSHRTPTSGGHHLLGSGKPHFALDQNLSLYQQASTGQSEEQIANLMQLKQMLQNNKRLDPLFFADGFDNDTLGGGGSGEGFSEPLAHQQEHIIQAHSESARNALIYIAVILGIYLIAVAFIAVQYYRKHSTLDPLTAFILRRSTRRSKDVRSSHSRKHARRRYSTSSGSGFETIRSVPTSSSLGIRNGSSSVLNGEGCTQVASSSSGVRFEQQATVYGENGTTTTTLESNKCSSSEAAGGSANAHQVSIQINIEHVPDDDIEESNVEDDYYDEDEEDDDDEEEEDEFEEEEMAVLPSCAAPTAECHPPAAGCSKTQRLKNLFTHFHSHSTDATKGHAGEHNSSPSHGSTDNHLATMHNGKTLTRSSSLQAADVPSRAPVIGHIDPESGTWRPNEVDLLKFKRSSIAGFTVAASTGPLGMFKVQPRHYEETHL